MNSISPQMLGLNAGQITLVNPSSAGGGPGDVAPIRRLLRTAARRRRVLLGCIGAGVVVGLLATLLMTRQYASTAQLQISRETTQVVNVGNVSRDIWYGDQEFYQTQYGLMRAQSLAERVARDLGAPDDPAFFKMFGKSSLFERNAEAAGYAKREELAGQILLHHVEVAPVHGSSLVDVRAVTPSPQWSQRIARKWSEDFVAGNLERRLAAAGYARQFLDARLQQLRDKLESAERTAMAYASSHGIIDLPSPIANAKPSDGDDTQTRSLVTDDLTAFNSARDGATAERIQALTKLAAVDSEPDSSGDALGYRAIGLLRTARANAAGDYAKQVAQAGPDSPAAKAARAEVAALDEAIAKEGARLRTALQQNLKAASAREQALNQKVDGLKASLVRLRQESVQYNIYRRDADASRELYNALLQRYKEIGVAGEAENNNVFVTDPARLPDEPSSPRLIVNLLLFTLAGAAIGLISAAVLEQIDPAPAAGGQDDETAHPIAAPHG